MPKFINLMMQVVLGQNAIDHRWQTQGPWAESNPPPCFIQPSTLFLTLQQLWAPSPWLRSSYIYTVLKLHSALWRQLWGWCGPRWKWVPHPCHRSWGSSTPDEFPTHSPGTKGNFNVARHVSFVDCPGRDIFRATVLDSAAGGMQLFCWQLVMSLVLSLRHWTPGCHRNYETETYFDSTK